MRALALLIIAACFAAPATAQKVYKCRADNGSSVYQSTPCLGTTQEKVFGNDAPKPRKLTPDEVKMQERRAGWEKLCDSSSWQYTRDCIDDHSKKYSEMNNILSGPPSRLRDKAAACYLRWFKEAAGVVDAKMWRHCYYN